MSPPRCWALSIELSRRHGEALAARLAALGHPSFEERSTRSGSRVLVYAESATVLETLRAALERESPDPLGPLRFDLSEVASDWALEWTKYLAPVALTPALTLYPWRPEASPRPGELFLEPAFAFGFGEHASTRLLARWIERACRTAPGLSLLDVGCGTGVLALVARRCGAARVVGVDLSAAAIDAAKANAQLNALDDIRFLHGSVEDVSEPFDRVVANIEAGVLLALAPQLVARLRPGGELALAGLIREQRELVERAYAALGVDVVLAATTSAADGPASEASGADAERPAREREDDWCLLVGSRPALC